MLSKEISGRSDTSYVGCDHTASVRYRSDGSALLALPSLSLPFVPIAISFVQLLLFCVTY